MSKIKRKQAELHTKTRNELTPRVLVSSSTIRMMDSAINCKRQATILMTTLLVEGEWMKDRHRESERTLISSVRRQKCQTSLGRSKSATI